VESIEKLAAEVVEARVERTHQPYFRRHSNCRQSYRFRDVVLGPVDRSLPGR
jgi:hypothetical protein